MADIKVTLEIDNRQYLAELNKADTVTKQFEKTTKNSSDGMIAGFSKLQVAAAAVTASFFATAQSVMSFADNIVDLAKAHETSAASVLAFGKALAQNGGNADNAGRAYLELAKSIAEANGGNLKTLSTFERLGVTISDLGALSETEIRDKLIKGLEGVRDPSERAALAAQMFGKALNGVDLRNIAQSIEENNAKYAKHEAALQSAADAYDNIAGVITDFKIAFAEAFKPLFDLINNIKPDNIDAIATALRHIGVALLVMGSAAVVNGLNAVRVAIIGIGSASAKNPILAIGMLIAQLGLGVYEMAKAEKEVAAETEKATEKTETHKKSQDGLIEKLGQARKQLEKITEGYKIANEAALKKLDTELETLGLSEEEKKVRTELGNIELATQNKLLELKNAFQGMDADMQAKQRSAYNEQIQQITKQGELQKSNVEQRLRAIESEKRLMEATAGTYNIFADGLIKLAEQTAAFEKLGKTAQERVAIEQRMNELIAYQKSLREGAGKMFDTVEAAKFNEAIASITRDTELLNLSSQELTAEYEKRVIAAAKEAGISEESIKKLIELYGDQLVAINGVGQLQAQMAEETRKRQRDFSVGWKDAFQQYADDATNAARLAERLFTKLTQGLEDAFVNFAKTGKFAFKDLMASLVEELLRSQIRQLLAQTFSFGNNVGGSIFSGIGKLFGFADGGSIPLGRPVLVGERGPELFVPSSNGTVVPNGQLSSGGNVTYNISAVDAASFKEMIAKDPAFIHAVAMQGSKYMPGNRR